jgi:5-formyltetrahydrofolate cyclo-ligase
MKRATDAPAPVSGAPDPILAAKHAARARAREARECLDLIVCRAHAANLAERLLALTELSSARVVLAYAALPAEIDPSPAIDVLRARGARIAYTRIEAPGVLGLQEVDSEVELVPGPLGIRQPSPDAPRVAHEAVDAVIVPGVAYDEFGSRLGYGGGYFDRLLPLLRPDCIRIGVAFDEQLLAEIPSEEHDAHVDFVVTPSRTIRTPRSS